MFELWIPLCSNLENPLHSQLKSIYMGQGVLKGSDK